MSKQKPTTKQQLIAIFITVAVLFLMYRACSSITEPPETDPEEEPARKALIQHFIDNEPTAIESFVTDADVLYVSVQDDGTRRDGYAEYCCNVANTDYPKAGVSRVIIFRVGSHKDPNRDNAYGVHLGESWCEGL